VALEVHILLYCNKENATTKPGFEGTLNPGFGGSQNFYIQENAAFVF